MRLGQFAGDIQSVASNIASGLRGQINRPQIDAASDYLVRLGELRASITEFEALASRPLTVFEGDEYLSWLSYQMEELEQSRELLRDWSSWCAVRTTAIARGLEALVNDLENGAVSPENALKAFQLGYARGVAARDQLERATEAFPALRARICYFGFQGHRRCSSSTCGGQGCEFVSAWPSACTTGA